MTAAARLERIAPFFIVRNLAGSIDFYTQKLGFSVDVLLPEEYPFFAIVCRDDVQILLKHITDAVPPLPNERRHTWARWDAFIRCTDPDALFAEYQERGVTFHEPLADTSDGLRAFELKDYDGYVLCFGKPL